MSATQVEAPPKAGMTAALAVIYGLYGAGFLIAIGAGSTIQGMQLEWADAWLPALILAAGVGVWRRTRWGRWLGYLVSLPLLLGVPIGTMLGGFMIWQLTKYRESFSKVY